MQCGAKTKSGQPCKKHGMPNGKCRLHGGLSPGAPVKSGRYSVVHRRSLQTKMQTMAADPTPGDLAAELALQRALLDEYLGRFTDGLALPADDIERLFGWLESIGKQTERIHRIMAQTALTVAEVNLLQAVLADLLRRYLPDEQRELFMMELTAATGGVVDGRANDTVIRVQYADDVRTLTDEQLQAIVDGR